MAPVAATAFLLVGAVLMTFATGCGTCHKKPATHGQDSGPAPEPAGPSKPAEGEAPADLQSDRLPVRMIRLPASYFGLDRATHTRMRVLTSRLGETDPEAQNPTLLPGFDVVGLDPAGREPNSDRWNQEIKELYEALIENKIFTAAKPLMVIFNADAGQGEVQWAVVVPVAEGIEVKPPLVRWRVPTMKVHVERGSGREILAKFGGRREENPTVWTFVRNVRKAAGPALARPTIMMVRFPEWDLADLDEEKKIEVILGEPQSDPSPQRGPSGQPGEGPEVP